MIRNVPVRPFVSVLSWQHRGWVHTFGPTSCSLGPAVRSTVVKPTASIPWCAWKVGTVRSLTKTGSDIKSSEYGRSPLDGRFCHSSQHKAFLLPARASGTRLDMALGLGEGRCSCSILRKASVNITCEEEKRRFEIGAHVAILETMLISEIKRREKETSGVG